jgi:hypothetical protein
MEGAVTEEVEAEEAEEEEVMVIQSFKTPTFHHGGEFLRNGSSTVN